MRVAGANALGAAELYELLRLRVDVFVVEQECAYPELDGRDLEPGTRHFWVHDGVPVAYLRTLAEPDGTVRIGRVCTAKQARGLGHGRRLMVAALDEVGVRTCVLDAQTYVVDFYASFGFMVEGDEFIEDGIPHRRMRRSP
ncbi:GNAT family N-acetyltransferase [Saccharothrix violaceirubra]|uniref:GNAT family N-acetyltransferase n=1 Tax=Saccharothrix violaceirubra TaxID=413306 RepID=UPI001C88C2BB